MSRYAGLAGRLTRKVTVHAFDENGAEITDEIKLNYPKMEDLSELIPLMDKLKPEKDPENPDAPAKEVKFTLGKPEILAIKGIIFGLVKEQNPDSADEDLKALIDLNFIECTTALLDMIKKSVSFMGADDKKKVLEMVQNLKKD